MTWGGGFEAESVNEMSLLKAVDTQESVIITDQCFPFLFVVTLTCNNLHHNDTAKERILLCHREK